MDNSIKTITLEGFKSIRRLNEFHLGSLNVLIGANGAGKSNLLEFFKLARAMANQSLTGFVNQQGADGFFYLGPKYTPKIKAGIHLGDSQYEFELVPTANSEIVVGTERVRHLNGGSDDAWFQLGNGNKESLLKLSAEAEVPAWLDNVHHRNRFSSKQTLAALSSWTVYHLQDTSWLAHMRRFEAARDFDYLRPDAANIAAYLLRLKTTAPEVYLSVRETIQLVAPFFDDFRLRPEDMSGGEHVRLEWTQKGSDFPFQPSQFSDGTLRFICLTTALLQPTLPATILIDEPELGLHPYALEILAGLLRMAAKRSQVIVSTQSAQLLDEFEPEDVIVVNRKNGASEFQRLDRAQLSRWLDEYTLGELWQKNYLEGVPANE